MRAREDCQSATRGQPEDRRRSRNSAETPAGGYVSEYIDASREDCRVVRAALDKSDNSAKSVAAVWL